MTKQQFISKEQAYKKISGKGAVMAVLSVLGVSVIAFGGIAAVIYAQTQVRNQWVSVPLTFVAFCVLIVALGICYQLFIRFLMRRLLRFGLVCTGCGCGFFGPSAKIVLKTGKCGRCGDKVLDDLPNV
jgi:hypothetical protein